MVIILKKKKQLCEHDFDEWKDFSIKKFCPYYEAFCIKQGYVLVTYPVYKRVCKKCGYIEESNNIQKKLIR